MIIGFRGPAATALLSLIATVGASEGPQASRVLIAGGGYHSLALDPQGNLWAWGANLNGQLGEGTRFDRHISFESKLPQGARPLGIALASAGQVWSFGDNTLGQLCRDRLGASLPQTVVADSEHLGSTPVVAVAAGFYHSLLLTADYRIWACGFNYSGQLGDWTYMNQERPSPLWRQCCSAERR